MGNAYDISYLYCHTAFLFIKEYLKIILSAPQETFLYRVKREVRSAECRAARTLSRVHMSLDCPCSSYSLSRICRFCTCATFGGTERDRHQRLSPKSRTAVVGAAPKTRPKGWERRRAPQLVGVLVSKPYSTVSTLSCSSKLTTFLLTYLPGRRRTLSKLPDGNLITTSRCKS